jgi:hypothetical protein
MTLHTQAPLGTPQQEMFVHRPGVGIMAAHAIHGHAIARVLGFIPERMGKRLVFDMASGADFPGRILDHAGPVRTMQIMAIGTFVPTRMLMQHLRPATEGCLMTLATAGPLITGQQPRPVSDMGIMAGDAGIAAGTALQMAVGAVEAGKDILVAGQTNIGPRGFAVTGLTAVLREGLMLDLTQQAALLAAVGMVAPETIHPLRIVIAMDCLQTTFILMAGQTEGTILALQQPVIVTAMGIVTGGTAPRPVRLMAMDKGFLRLRMATGTEFPTRFGQQAGIGRGMGCMALGAGPLLDRLMEYPTLFDPSFGLLMAAEAEGTLSLQQERLMACHVRAVTSVAAPLRHRGMGDLALEISALVTIETGCRQHRPNAEKPSQHQQNHRSFHGLPPV